MSITLAHEQTRNLNEEGVPSEDSEAPPRLELPPEDTLQHLVAVLKLLGDETRLRILFLLHQSVEMNVLEICKHLDQRQPSVSHHLGLLREAGLIAMRREGKHNFYRTQPEQFEETLTTILDTEAGNPFRNCLENFELR